MQKERHTKRMAYYRISLIRNRAVKKKVCTDIVQTYLVSLSWSFLPCRWSFWLILSCHNPSLYPSAPVQALWRPRLKKNDVNLLLLVTSIFSKSRNKALQYGKIVCHSYRCTMNILTKETATGTLLVTPCWVWEV